MWSRKRRVGCIETVLIHEWDVYQTGQLLQFRLNEFRQVKSVKHNLEECPTFWSYRWFGSIAFAFLNPSAGEYKRVINCRCCCWTERPDRLTEWSVSGRRAERRRGRKEGGRRGGEGGRKVREQTGREVLSERWKERNNWRRWVEEIGRREDRRKIG